MNEQELRDGLHEVMVASSPPPSMNPNSALDAARRAHRRRRATWAGAGAGLAVVAVASTVVVTLGRGAAEEIPVAAPPVPKTTTIVASDTKLSLPDGQTDRTAHNGPRADRGVQLYDSLVAALPATIAPDPRPTAEQSGGGDPMSLSMKQAQIEEKNGNVEVWRYTAIVAVGQKAQPMAGTGQVYVEVLTPGNNASSNACEAASEWWGNKGACTMWTVQGKQVGVVTASPDGRLEQVAAYRYNDGTLVVTAQSPNVAFTKLPSMGTEPLTVDQLAALTLNPAFKLS